MPNWLHLRPCIIWNKFRAWNAVANGKHGYIPFCSFDYGYATFKTNKETINSEIEMPGFTKCLIEYCAYAVFRVKGNRWSMVEAYAWLEAFEWSRLELIPGVSVKWHSVRLHRATNAKYQEISTTSLKMHPHLHTKDNKGKSSIATCGATVNSPQPVRRSWTSLTNVMPGMLWIFREFKFHLI